MGCCSKKSAVQVKPKVVAKSAANGGPAVVAAAAAAAGPHRPQSIGNSTTSSLPPPITPSDMNSQMETPTFQQTITTASPSTSAVRASSQSWSTSTVSSRSSQPTPVVSDAVRTVECEPIVLESDLAEAVCWDEDLALGKLMTAEDHSTKASSDSGADAEEQHGDAEDIYVRVQQEEELISASSAALISYRSSADLTDLHNDAVASSSVSESESALSPLPKIGSVTLSGPGLSESGESNRVARANCWKWCLQDCFRDRQVFVEELDAQDLVEPASAA